MTALNDPGQPDDQEEDCFENPPVPRTAVEDPSDDDDWGDDDDDEEDRGGADGYQLLPQDLQQLQDQGPGGTEQASDDEMSDDDSALPDLSSFNPNSESFETEARRNWISEEARERVEIFSSSNETISRREIDLNKDKISAIQTAMAKISLPPTSVPVWADKLSEDDWNQLIRDRFGAQQKVEQNLSEKSASLQKIEKASTSTD